MLLGFSTGALALGDFRQGLELNNAAGCNAVELSALRASELTELITAFDELPLDGLAYVSFHAPSRLEHLSENDLVKVLSAEVVERNWPIIVHPDIITDFGCWGELGNSVLIENMDQRKPVGRDAEDLRTLFRKLPEARLCFDIAHARQVDPTMSIAVEILTEFGDRLAEVHISEVDSASRHVPMSDSAVRAYQRISHLIPHQTPVIIESVLGERTLAREIESAKASLGLVPGVV